MSGEQPTPASPKPRRGRQTRNAAASKQALFDAAKQLFSQKGFEQTTLREIAELAGVDSALIAYYFGSKGDLYVTVVMADRMTDSEPPTPEQVDLPFEGLESVIDAVLRRSDRHGPGPILQALMRHDTSEEIRVAARARLERQLIEPLLEAMAADGDDDARLHAEVAMCALLGISLGRSLGWFEEVGAVPRAKLASLTGEALGGFLGGQQEGR